MKELSDEQKTAISIIATSKNTFQGLKESKYPKSSFYYFLENSKEFRELYETTRERYLVDKQNDIAFNNLILHEESLKATLKYLEEGTLKPAQVLEALKISGQEFVSKGQQAYKLAKRIVKKLEKEQR